MRVFARAVPVILVALLLLSGCALRPLLSEVAVAPTDISPNADGDQDVTLMKYRIGRLANVSIYFENEAGERFYFRDGERRSPGRYSVYWGGVNNTPEVRATEGGDMLIESQVLPDGTYTWVIEAAEPGGATQKVEGQITLTGSDTTLPELHNFTVVPQDFTPNQDGIHDRVAISYYLTKDAEDVLVYLTPQDSSASGRALRYPIAENPTASRVEPGRAGYHGYDYDGGVDLYAEPPPDGDYVISGQAADKVGNRVVVSSTLTIREGGKPRANIVEGEIDWGGESKREIGVRLDETFCFTATVQNDGPVPIRTSGPWPGQTYKFSENYNTLAKREGEDSWSQQAGVWRFGVNFDTTGVDFPFRWAIGRPEDLEERVIDGVSQYYLLPGKRSQVSGCITMDEAPPVGTQFWWGGLIHEFVEVANNNVDRVSVQVGVP